MSFSHTGKVWSRQTFAPYGETGKRPDWVRGITLHHTGAPSLKTRPNGLTITHIENIRDYYQNQLGWKSGPHLFIDDTQIFGMTPLYEKGVHARSFNRSHVGIEVLGNYDIESHDTGRGMECWLTAAYAIVALRRAWGKLPLNLHRNDPKTSKTCPGAPVTVAWVEQLVELASDEHPSAPRRPCYEETTGNRLVPVLAYLGNVKPAPKLTRRSGQTYLNDWRLETGHYDKYQQTTLASEHELKCWLAAQPE